MTSNLSHFQPKSTTSNGSVSPDPSQKVVLMQLLCQNQHLMQLLVRRQLMQQPMSWTMGMHSPRSPTSDNFWIFDFGCFNHMSPYPAGFITKQPSQHPTVRTAHLTPKPVLFITDVLHVPGLAIGIVSLTQLQEMGLLISFDFSDPKTKQILGKGRRVGRTLEVVYLRLPLSSSYTNLTASISTTSSFDIWHARLGHLSSAKIKLLANSGLLGNTTSNEVSSLSCKLGKYHALPFELNDYTSDYVFDLIHSDVWGPAPHPSMGGCRYFVIFIDDHTRFTWIYLMKHRSELPQIYITFARMIQTQFFELITLWNTNNLLSSSFFDLKALSLSTLVRTSAKCPERFWGEAAFTAVYTINRHPTPILQNKSPYETLHGITPAYELLKVWGCACFVQLQPHEHTKLQPRSRLCLFLGYGIEHKGYRCWDPISKRLRISRNVTFWEHVPFYTMPNSQIETPTSTVSEIEGWIEGGRGRSMDEHQRWRKLEETGAFLRIKHAVRIRGREGSFPGRGNHLLPVIDPYATHPYACETHAPAASPIPISEAPTHVAPPVPSTHIPHPPTTGSPDPAPGPVPPTQPSVPSQPPSSEPSVESTDLGPSSSENVQRSNRVRQVPSHLRDYHCYATLLSNHEPTSYKEASSSSLWQAAMQEELQALAKAQTWDHVPLPPGKRPIGSKWVFKIRQNGSVDRYKARLVAKGFNQEYGIDYEETFAPVARVTSVSSLLAIAATKRWALFQMDSLSSTFEMKDLRKLHYFLGLEVFSDTSGTYLCQAKYISDLLSKAGLSDTKVASTPLEHNLHLTPSAGTPLQDPTRYRQLVGSLVYLTVTRPDIAYAVHTVSQFMATPRSDHYAALLRILRYLKGTMFHGMYFSSTSSLVLRGFSDVDWDSDMTDRRSTTGYCFFLGDSLISWRSKKQSLTVRSSTKAEYRALADTSQELIWLRWLLSDMGAPQKSPTPLWCDNNSAIQIAHNDVFHERTKHIEIDCHFVRQHVVRNTIQLHPISTLDQPADIFTKAHLPGRFRELVDKLNLCRSSPD
ncbi:LOW QUALITY PROTEIN: hypothetical protein OSB04_028676 [Centaurea solstitialis]|uniref:Retrovirus-related Pol polyprotein from transposon TNT 1-94 n=1 Tax=Centaurea solstitialis TaxID=347529 RepID=A0AA38STN5_9ASTR|nr:LOW QUALITY PROTEIN: hypothetical protein OSB04_028676 [Centaurea solstitialis]